MPLQSYNRPAAHPTLPTQINLGFAGSLQATCPSMFSLATFRTNFAHHDTLTIGDETFQWVDPDILSQVTDDSYIAVLKKNTGNGIDFVTLAYALGRVTGAQVTDLATFTPVKTDGITFARTTTAHSFVTKNFKINVVDMSVPAVRQLITAMDLLSSPPGFTVHDLIVVGNDTYEVLEFDSGTPSHKTLTNDSHIPIDLFTAAGSPGPLAATLTSIINSNEDEIESACLVLEDYLATDPFFIKKSKDRPNA